MAYFPQTNSTERTAQIDTIGWVFVSPASLQSPIRFHIAVGPRAAALGLALLTPVYLSKAWGGSRVRP